MVSNPKTQCQIIDNTLGPSAGECRGGFDFTLLFEEIILTVLPFVPLLFVVPLRILYLFKRSVKVTQSPLLPIKLVSLDLLNKLFDFGYMF